MRRSILTFAIAAVFGGFLMAGNASACFHKKKVACAPAPVACEPCAPPPVVYTACAPVPAKCHSFKMPKIKMPKLGGCFHHKKVVVASCDTCGVAPVTYAAPQAISSPQILSVPQK